LLLQVLMQPVETPEAEHLKEVLAVEACQAEEWEG
jgi:hypothetical protein